VRVAAEQFFAVNLCEVFVTIRKPRSVHAQRRNFRSPMTRAEEPYSHVKILSGQSSHPAPGPLHKACEQTRPVRLRRLSEKTRMMRNLRSIRKPRAARGREPVGRLV